MLYRVLLLIALSIHSGFYNKSTDIPVEDVSGVKHPKSNYYRIIPLAPNIAGICLSLGLEKKIIAVSENYQNSLFNDIPKLDWWNVNYESIILLKPDLVITSASGNSPKTVSKLRELGINVFHTRQDTIEEIAVTVEKIGYLTGTDKRASEIASRIKNFTSEQRKINSALKTKRKRVLYLLWHRPLMAPAGDTFLSEVIWLAGGENIFSDVKGKLVKPSLEEVLMLDPEVIFLPESVKADELDSRWSSVSAIRNRRIYHLDEDTVLRPGINIIEGIKQVRKILEDIKGKK